MFPLSMRRRISFGGPDDSIQSPQDNEIDPLTLYDKMFQPNYAANEAYVRAAQNIPQMQQRSRLDKLGAFLAGLGTGGPAGISEGHLIGYRGNPVEAYNTARGILRGPYDEAVERYKLRLEPLKAQATLEEQRNRDMSARALTLIERINQSRREDRLLRGEGERERHNREVENIRRYSQTHPNYKLIQDEATSEYHFVNPQNPKESPIPTGLYNLTDTEKINLNFAGRMQIEQYRQSEETKRERERETAITGRQENKPEKEELPTQEAQRWRNNAAVAKLNPRYAPFIIGTSPYVTDKPTKGWFESEPDYQKRVQDWLETVAYVHAPRPERKGRTQTRKTTVTMVAPDGTEQEVDPSKVEFYKSRGAKVKQ